jgi:hypothetical protein
MFFEKHTIDWTHVKSLHVNAYATPQEAEDNWHYYVMTLILEVSEQVADTI